MAEDYYKTLGVRRDASAEEIRKAYHKLARKNHPDMKPDDARAKKKFQQIQAAFDVLGNPEKRRKYDQFGSSFENIGGAPGQGPFPGGFSPGGFSFEDVDLSEILGGLGGGRAGGRAAAGPGGGFADIFSQFAGGGPSPSAGRRPRRGAEVRAEVTVPFNTAVTGGEVAVTLYRPSGKVETITVKIPAGIEEGKKMRLSGQGEPARHGGPAGDLILSVRIAPHPHFTRVGRNLHVVVPVTLAEAVLGAKVDVPTPRGAVALRVPPRTSGGAKLRIKGYGVTPGKGQAGDLLAEIQIALPEEFDEESLKMIRQVDERCPHDARKNLRW